MTTSIQDGVMAVDILYCEKNSNTAYNLSIAKGGCLNDKSHIKYQSSHQNAVKATNKEKLNITVFDWTYFDLDETNERLKVALEIHGASCLCCVEDLYLKSVNICAVCANSNNLKHCSRCQATAYCSPVCQKADWPKHKLVCADLKLAAELVRARGEVSYTTGLEVRPPPSDQRQRMKDSDRKNFPGL